MSSLDDLFGVDDNDEVPTDGKLRRSPACGVLKFHSPAAEEGLFLHLERCASTCRGNPGATLKAIDHYAQQTHWLMCIGPEKADVIQREALTPMLSSISTACCDSSISRHINVVELGSYLGYSAVSIANSLIRMGVTRELIRIVSIEGDPLCVEWTKRMASYCDLSDVITVVHSVENHAAALSGHFSTIGAAVSVDLLLIDHDKALYTSDLRAFEAASLLRSGTIVCADNILCFGKPLTEYLNYVRDTSRYKSTRTFETQIEYADDANPVEGKTQDDIDAIEISVCL